jgi:hypothetical protein
MNTVTGNRYRLANKVVWRVGYGAMQLAGDGRTSTCGHLTENLATGSLSLREDEISSLRSAFGM